MRRGTAWALYGAGLLGLYVGARVLTTYWDFNSAAAELPQAIRDYRAAGLPWTAAELDRHVPPERNAAPLVRRALAAMPGKKVDERFDRDWRLGKADPTPYTAALEIFHQAAKLPDLDFERDWDLGQSLLFHEPSRLKFACKVFAVRAARRAAGGDDEGALQDLTNARRLASLVGKSPSLIEALTNVNGLRMADAGVQNCLRRVARDPDRIARYRQWLEEPAQLPDLRSTLRGEIYSRIAIARNLDLQGVGTTFWPQEDFESIVDLATYTGFPRREGIPDNLRARAYFARCLQSWTELSKQTNGLQAPLDRISDCSQLIQERQEAAKGWSHLFNAVLSPASIYLSRLDQMALASRAVSLAFADALLLHTRTGSWPTRTAIVDPWSGQPLHVRVHKGEFRVWSVGRNGQNDGGLTAAEARVRRVSCDDEVAVFPPLVR